MAGQTTRQWGIVTSLTGLTAGFAVNSLDFNETAETAEARNETGQITDMAGYSKKTTLTATGVVDTAKGTLVTAGSKLTLANKDYLITSVQKKESNTAFVEVTVTCETADNAIITVITTSSTTNSNSSN